jgi:hypothetical protein
MAGVVAATSGVLSGLMAYTTHGTDSVQLPLIGNVSAPLAFAITNAASTYLGSYLQSKGELNVPVKYSSDVGNELILTQSVCGLSQAVLLKGATTNGNVGWGEAFAHGFAAPIVALELILTYESEPKSTTTSRRY